MIHEELREENERLKAAIRRHRDERGNDRCWLDDSRLYAEIEGSELANLSLPPREEFLTNCERYWQRRQPGVAK